jgi:hypothetical protein
MRKSISRTLVAIVVAAPVCVMSAAAPSIGVVLSDGTLTINNARTAGNATLFEGNTIETGTSSSRLRMNSGASVQLSSDARGTVYAGKLVLDRGATQFDGKSFEVNARTLHIVGDDARVSVSGNTVEVAALTTPVRVSNAAGELVANLEPGKALDFTPQDAGATAAGQTTDTTTTTTTSKKKKKKVAGAVVGGTAGGVSTLAIVAGVGVAAAVGVTSGVLATQSSGGGTCLSGCK